MEEVNQQASHGDLVVSAVNGGATSCRIEPCVLESWRRCIDAFEMDPEIRREPTFVERADLELRREKYCNLTKIAKLEMTNLFQQISGSGCSILLTDDEGVVLNYVGDPLFTTAAASTGLNPGAIWSEEIQGTNGMGTCLVEKRPLVIHRNEHFLTKNTGLTCSAAPIFDPAGRVAGVLDASSESRMAQQHTMVLVNMSAQLIENRLFVCEMRDQFLLRFHSRPEFVSTLGEGVIAFSPSGEIKAANRSALFQLDMDDLEAVRGRTLEDLFNVHLDEALNQARTTGGHPQTLHETRHRRRFYGTFQTPMDEAGRTVHTQPVVSRPTPSSSPLDQLEFGDARMRRNIHRASKLLERDIPLLILGETGTGKDMFAKAAHQASSRRHQPYVAVNCASIPETLIESELFGYQAGAFTGASREGSRGKIVQAHGGTLFLDEIGDMPLQLQARLLRVLEEREVIPLGGETPVSVDIRLISATHQDLQARVDEGSFREDLFYRLHGISLVMPPLREREDRLPLIRHLLEEEAGGPGRVRVNDDALALLDGFEWPGNIRQLRNVLRTLVGLSEDGVIGLGDLPDEMFSGESPEPGDGGRPSSPLDIAERDAIIREMEAAHWNVTRVASKLSLSRNTLYRKMKRFGIRPPR